MMLSYHRMSCRGAWHRACWALMGLFIAGPAAAGDRPSPQSECLEYDETRGTWVQREAPVPGTPEGDLRLARADHTDGHYAAAYRRVRKWLETYGEADPRYPEAAVLRARIEIARRDYYKAHKHLQEFLNEYGPTQAADEAIHYEFVIADVFLKGTRRKLIGMRMMPAEDVGLSILDDLAANYPESPTAELALKTKADHFFVKGDFALAEFEYARLREQFPLSRYVRYALRRSADAALGSFPGIEFDDAGLIEAEARFRDYLAQYPGVAEQEGVGLVLANIREQRATKELHVGEYYRKTERPRAAAFYYRSTLATWPETVAAREASGRLAEMGLAEVPETAGGSSTAPPPDDEDEPSARKDTP